MAGSSSGESVRPPNASCEQPTTALKNVSINCMDLWHPGGQSGGVGWGSCTFVVHLGPLQTGHPSERQRKVKFDKRRDQTSGQRVIWIKVRD